MVRCLLVFSIKSRVYITENRVYRKQRFSFFFFFKANKSARRVKWLLVLAKFSLTHMPFIIG